MTGRSTTILLTILLFACSQKEKRTIAKTFPSGKLQKEIVYPNSNDSLNYSEISYFENGQIKTNIEFHDGRFNGKTVEFYENGKKKFEGVTEMSHFVGVKYNYDDNGKISEMDSLSGKCLATDCCCDGVVIRYYSNGQVKERFTNKDGLFNGEYLSFYETGQLKSQRHFSNDKENGLSKYWSKKGKLTNEETYKDDIKEGSAVEHHDYFNVFGQYSNGKETGDWKYIDTAGKLIKTEHYINGVLRK